MYYTKSDVAKYNNDRLIELGNPVAQINAGHSTTFAKNATPDDMLGLEPVLYIARNAAVMLTCNLWPAAGLCNGSTGHVVDIIYKEGHEPPYLPIAIIVKFDDYTGESFLNETSSCVPICPLTASIANAGLSHER